MIGLIWTIILGAFVGWIASIVMKRDSEQGWIANIIVGIIGAFLGGFISSLVVGGDRSSLALDISSLFWAFVGAVALLAAVNYAQRGQVR